MTTTRRDFLRTAGAALGAAATVSVLGRSLAAQQQQALPTMTVYKSASCGCCRLWVDHIRTNGITVRTVDTDNLGTVKSEMGIPGALASCHTAVIGGFLVEGHVPAGDIKRLLREKPKVRGLAVPGMPIGSPGMEQGPVAGYERYEVLAFEQNGSTRVFATHGPPTRR